MFLTIVVVIGFLGVWLLLTIIMTAVHRISSIKEDVDDIKGKLFYIRIAANDSNEELKRIESR